MEAVGIDLGTTNSLVGAVLEGRAVLFGDPSGNELLPSVVGASGAGDLVVGRAAKNRRLLDPSGTVASIKRRMGTKDRVRVGKSDLSPPEVSALILGSLLDRAEGKLGKRPARAVITVPAWFDDAQRQATRDAGEIAGLAVERLVNEPTAAALTYRTGVEQMVMVYDLGGGTFDVSVLERDEALLEVRQSRGDTRLGGDDIDLALAESVLARLGAGRRAVESDPRAMVRLVEAVERAKIALSDREEVHLFDPFLAGDGADGVHLDLTLTRADVERAARPLIERTLACIDAALRDAKLRPRDLDRVLLVGGASKMPIVRAMVAAHLGRPAQLDLDADRAVALGAALLAGRIEGAEIADVLVDITPHTLSVGASDREDDDRDPLVAVPVIPRGTVVPVVRTTTVATRRHDQRKADIPIAQGEEPFLDDNTLLGVVSIDAIPPSPAGSPVEVSFRLDLSGVLHVSARHVPSGRAAEVEIADSPYQLTAQKREDAKRAVLALREAAVEGDGEEEAAIPRATEADLSLAQAMATRARRALAKHADGDTPEIARARAALVAVDLAIEERLASTADLTDALSDALLDLV